MFKRGWIRIIEVVVMMAIGSQWLDPGHAALASTVQLNRGVNLKGNVTFRTQPEASPPPFCSVDGDKNTDTTIEGDVVYCDNSLKLWTPTAIIGGAATTKFWGPTGEVVGTCIDLGVSYPACNYCDTLIHADYDDWVLPSCANGWDEAGCQLHVFGIDACGSYPCTPAWDTNSQVSWYWSSNEYVPGTTNAWGVPFLIGGVYYSGKTSNGYVRCVRAGP